MNDVEREIELERRAERKQNDEFRAMLARSTDKSKADAKDKDASAKGKGKGRGRGAAAAAKPRTARGRRKGAAESEEDDGEVAAGDTGSEEEGVRSWRSMQPAVS